MSSPPANRSRHVADDLELGNPAVEVDRLEGFERLNDLDLFSAVRDHGDPAAFEILVRRHARIVLSVCRRRCRNAASAEDAFQVTFFCLWKSAGSIRSPERLAGWLHRVAARAAAATAEVRCESIKDDVADVSEHDALTRLAARHEATLLDEELAELPDKYRDVLVLHYFNGWSLQRIAEHTQVSTGTIRGRMQRGRKSLASRLRSRGIFPASAIASHLVTQTTPADAASRCDDAVTKIIGDAPPTPPAPIKTLTHPALQPWISNMPLLASLGGGIAVTVLVSMMLPVPDSPQNDGASGDRKPSVVLTADPATQPSSNIRLTTSPQTPADEPRPLALPASQEHTAGADLRFANTDPGLVEAVRARLNESFQAPSGPTTLDAFPRMLSEVADVPAYLDRRALQQVKFNPARYLNFENSVQPLRTALRKSLGEHELRAEPRPDGLAITVDWAAKIRGGWPSSRWINVDADVEQKVADALRKRTSQNFIELPLREAVRTLAESNDIAIAIDTHSLQENGLAEEELVSGNFTQAQLGNAIKTLLSPLGLTYTVRSSGLLITTKEDADDNLLIRQYDV